MKESISRYGYNVLIAVDTQNVIVTGHARYMALRELGWTEANVMVLDIPLERAKEYRIADNKAHEFSNWDLELLRKEIEEIDPKHMTPFFKEGTIDALMEGPLAGGDDDLEGDGGIGEETPGGGSLGAGRTLVCPKCLGEFTLEQVLGGLVDEYSNGSDGQDKAVLAEPASE